MSSKKILMACSNAWTSVFQVGSHHLAREFVKLGYEVGFVSNPISPFHLLGSLGERFRIYKSGGIWENRIWAYVPATLIPPHKTPFFQSEWVHRHWHQMTFPNVVKKVSENGFGEVDILYFDTAIPLFWLEAIRARKTVFRMPDNQAGFNTSAPALLQLEKELIAQVDWVVCTAKGLMDQVQLSKPQTAYFPNGVYFAHFAKETPIPLEYRRIPKPIAVYVGAIDNWFNYGWIKKAALELPQISFVLIGPVKKNLLAHVKNAYLLGPKPYSEIPAYLKGADVGIIPFDVEHYPELIHNVNPLKLYEYMACGLPVVATRWRELETMDSPALLCRDAEEFKAKLLEAIREPNLKNFYRSYAEKHDWGTKAKQLIELLQ